MKHPQFDYLGASLTWDDCEMLALARISEPHRREEPSLFATKWFDYRHLHPVSATYMFAARYAEAVREIYAQTKDRDEAETAYTFSPDDVFLSRELIGFWIARQAFDRIGVRYEFGLRYVMTRFSTRGWRMFPRPNQLYSEELILDVRDAWAAECKNSLQIAKHERFSVANYIAHPDQISYQEWLLQQTQTREHAHRPLSRLLAENLVTPDVIKLVFGEALLNQAIKLNAV